MRDIVPKRFISPQTPWWRWESGWCRNPISADDAVRALKLLSGRAHHVYTAVALVSPSGRTSSRIVDSKVRFKRLTREDIETYIGSAEWRGQGRRLRDPGPRRDVRARAVGLVFGRGGPASL